MATDYSWGGSWGGAGMPSIYGQRPGEFTTARYFADPNEKDKLFWQAREGMPFAFQRFVGQEANPGSHYERWLQNQEAQLTSGFVDASRAQTDLPWYQYIASQAPGLVARYTALPGWQQGMNAAPNFAGRRL